ncbi:hypothetical protein [Methylobacterium cerastii]|uniref:hypothetical protein n=1 Tax=Methylobacterium cerastii TaxID=932741 RepID=UPI001EE38FB5|nr:hypothetical protein [Methylobacterium cerastii]
MEQRLAANTIADGYANYDRFHSFAIEALVPMLIRSEIIVLDNLNIDNAADAREASGVDADSEAADLGDRIQSRSVADGAC